MVLLLMSKTWLGAASVISPISLLPSLQEALAGGTCTFLYVP